MIEKNPVKIWIKKYLHEHITSAVKVFCQLVVVMLFGQYGLHLHHPRCHEHIIRLNVPEKGCVLILKMNILL